MKKINYLLFAIFSTFLATFCVSASSYTSSTNLFENSYSNNLVDMANTQIDNFINKKFVIFQNEYTYYLVASDDYSISGNYITFNNSTIIRAYRPSGSYSSYEYSTFTEPSTTIYSDYVVISNTEFNRAISSKRFDEYRTDKYTITLLMFLLGLAFAIFLTKERKF